MPQRSAATLDRENGQPNRVIPRPVPERCAYTETIRITPDLATEWLNANTENRPLRESSVLVLARDMREGRWKVNGEAIKWSSDGILLDGQHRLFACIEAGVPFTTMVTFGLDPEVFATLDRGRRRTPADSLALLGEPNAEVLAAAVKKLAQLKRGVLFQHGPASTVGPEETIEVLGQHPRIRESIPFSRKVGRLAPPSLSTFLHFMFTQRDRALADWFMDRLGSGIGLLGTHGVYHLRKRLESNLIVTAKLPEKHVAALFIKAWNAHRAGRKVRTLRWRNTGEKPEAFPEIR